MISRNMLTLIPDIAQSSIKRFLPCKLKHCCLDVTINYKSKQISIDIIFRQKYICLFKQNMSFFFKEHRAFVRIKYLKHAKNKLI